MATMETISEALKLIPEKKSLLRQAFEDLQSHSSSLSSFSLSWSDLDSHFSALQSTLEAKFKLLQSQPPVSIPKPQPLPKIKPPPLDKVERGAEVAVVLVRPEVKSFCDKMDGLGLRNYIIKLKPKERSLIKDELRDAFKCSSNNAAAMVLDALDGFFGPLSNGNKDLQLVKKACIVMFEGIMESKVEISPEFRVRAKSLALDWKEKVNVDDSSVFESYGFLYLVATYGLLDVFSINDLFDMAVIVATRFMEAISLIRVLCFGDKISDLIQKVISKGKQVHAVRYILEFELADKFPPVTILEDFVNETKKNAEKIRKDGKNSLQSLNTATMKETSALQSVLSLIEDSKIEAELLKQSIIKRIELLEKLKADRKKKKKPEPSSAPKSQPQNLSGIKRPRVTPYTQIPNSVAFTNSANIPTIPTVHAYQQSNLQFLPSGLVPNVASNTSSTVPPYQQSYIQPASSLPNTHTQYSSPQAAAYALVEASLPHVPAAHQPDPNMASGYYKEPLNYGGYARPPQYHQSYQPR